MFIVPILLLGALLVIVIGANAMKKKGTMTESTYQVLVNTSSVVVIVAALVIIYMRLRGT